MASPRKRPRIGPPVYQPDSLTAALNRSRLNSRRSAAAMKTAAPAPAEDPKPPKSPFLDEASASRLVRKAAAANTPVAPTDTTPVSAFGAPEPTGSEEPRQETVEQPRDAAARA